VFFGSRYKRERSGLEAVDEVGEELLQCVCVCERERERERERRRRWTKVFFSAGASRSFAGVFLFRLAKCSLALLLILVFLNFRLLVFFHVRVTFLCM
jgi:hypothetical protein